MNDHENTSMIPATEIAEALPTLDVAAALADAPSSMYSSLVPATDADRATFFNGVNAPKYRIADEIGKTIAIRDVYVEAIAVKDEKAEDENATKQAPRIVLFDDKGEGHICVSMGILNALRKLFAIYGRPTWTTPVVVLVKQVNTTPTRKMLTLEVVAPAKK